MTNKLLAITLAAGIFGISTTNKYFGSTTAPVILAGAILKTKHLDTSNKKYKRKDCPVCKGNGWYISGDGIKKIDCNYCEPDIKTEPEQAETLPQSVSPQPKPSINSTKPHILRR